MILAFSVSPLEQIKFEFYSHCNIAFDLVCQVFDALGQMVECAGRFANYRTGVPSGKKFFVVGVKAFQKLQFYFLFVRAITFLYSLQAILSGIPQINDKNRFGDIAGQLPVDSLI
jgi:hypothetical protein